jgi:molybdenum cofactor sulfurtransferase
MIITIGDNWHRNKEGPLHNRLEDGTLPFHSIFALDHAITVHERLYGPNPMKFISHHTAQLGKQLFDGLSSLKHANGKPLCIIYKDEVAVYGDPSLQGATVAFNVVRGDGTIVGYEEVEEAADERSIFVRSGSLCNPGGMASYLDWSPSEMKAAYAAGHRCTNPTQIMFGRPTGVVRVSLGAMSTASDVRTLLHFLDDVYVDKDGESRTAVANALQMARSMSSARPASPMVPGSPAHMPALASQAKPDTAATWVNIQPESAITPEIERPRFVPADYIKYRKPWEEEMRKQHATATTHVGPGGNIGMEIKIRELDDASSRHMNGTPSVKARKFGRSVVNLLRTKHAQGETGSTRYVPPTTS